MTHVMVTMMITMMTVIMVLINEIVMAQPGLPGPPSQAPIDGGLTLLAAAGGAYAIKKLKDRNKKEISDL